MSGTCCSLWQMTSIYSLTQVHEETGVLLIKPIDLIPRLEEIKEDAKEINQADILEAANIPKERAKRRKTELLAQAAAAKEPPLSIVEGEGVTCDGSQGSSWKVWGGAIMCIPGKLPVWYLRGCTLYVLQLEKYLFGKSSQF